MKIYKNQTVFDAALDRIRWIYDEFPEVVVNFSGGKDSTVLLELSLMVAKEKNRLPIKLMFLDQEAEWEHVISYVRKTMERDEIKPLWFQMPIRIFNATNHTEHWLNCWNDDEQKEWMREREPDSIKINDYGNDRFKELFKVILDKDFPGKACYLAGVRTEESPARFVGLTHYVTYKHATYGKILNKKKPHMTFYPLYDWSYTDVWKAIHEYSWDYSKIYDYMYQYGHSINDMRVSNLHHETSLKQLFFLQEIEPRTWEKLTLRINGINTAGHMKGDFNCPSKLPYMFKNWTEYRDHLLEKLVPDSEIKQKFKKKFEKLDKLYIHNSIRKAKDKTCATAILANDYYMTKLDNFERAPEVYCYRNWMRGKMSIDKIEKKYFGHVKDALQNPVPEEKR